MILIMLPSREVESKSSSPVKTCEVIEHNALFANDGIIHSLRFVSDENESGNVPVKGFALRIKNSSQLGG